MDKVEQTFNTIRREDFVPDFLRSQASFDAPLSIGYGQTISQPSTVKSMLRWLNPKEGDRILDIGSGSGWTSALLSAIVEPSGKIFAVEIIPELLEFGKNNCKKLGIDNIEFFQARKELGLPEYSPYDGILVSASANEFPPGLLQQLKVGGKLIIPVRDDIIEATKTSDTDHLSQIHHGYLFVPLK